MDWVRFLFGFDGRINRAKLWLAMLVIVSWMIFTAVLMYVIGGMFGISLGDISFNIDDIFGIVDPVVIRTTIAQLRDGKSSSFGGLVLTFVHGAGMLIFVWVYLATSVKRLHDREKSAVWMFPYFAVPGLYGQFQDRLPDSYMLLPFSFAAFALLIGGFIDLYFLQGTRSTNRFGADPLAPIDTRPGWSQDSEIGIYSA